MPRLHIERSTFPAHPHGGWEGSVSGGLLDSLATGRRTSLVPCSVGLSRGELRVACSIRARVKMGRSTDKMGVTVFCKLVSYVTFHHLCHILHLGSKSPISKGRGFHKIMNTGSNLRWLSIIVSSFVHSLSQSRAFQALRTGLPTLALKQFISVTEIKISCSVGDF